MNLTKSEVVNWVNITLPSMSISKVEQLGTGVVFCSLMNHYIPNVISISKINLRAKSQVESIPNFKLLQQAFHRVGVQRNIDIEKLTKFSFQDNFDLAMFLHKFFASSKERLDSFSFVEEKKVELKKIVPKKQALPLQKENKQCVSNIAEETQRFEVQKFLEQRQQLEQLMKNRDLDTKTKFKQINQLFQFQIEEEMSSQQVKDEKLFLTQSRNKEEMDEFYEKTQYFSQEISKDKQSSSKTGQIKEEFGQVHHSVYKDRQANSSSKDDRLLLSQIQNNLQFDEIKEEADLLSFDDVRQIEETLSKEKECLQVPMMSSPLTFAPNIISSNVNFSFHNDESEQLLLSDSPFKLRNLQKQLQSVPVSKNKYWDLEGQVIRTTIKPNLNSELFEMSFKKQCGKMIEE